MVAPALSPREQLRKDIATILTAVAAGGLAAVVSFIVFGLDKRTPGALFWWLVFASVVTLGLSIFFGGKGIVNLGQQLRGYFNLQAIFLIVGWALVILTIFSVRTGGKNELETLTKSVENLNAEINQLKKEAAEEKVRRAEVQGELRALQERLNSPAANTKPPRKSSRAAK